MKNRIAATVTVAIGLGLACPFDAAAQTAEAAQPAPDAPAAEAAPPQSAAAEAPKTIAVRPQSEGAEAPQAAGEIPTVVVTARRTEESIQTVPVAISAFSADDLQREKIGNAQDLQGRVPSLTVSANSQQRNTELPTIRGQGASFGTNPGVVIYFAEVPSQTESVTNGQGGPGKFFDLANVQVLKGSQGTLFGRNTTGGALLLEPHKPDARYEFALRAQASNFSGKTAEGILNVPLIEDTLLLRVAAQYVTRAGFTHDVTTGKDYDNKRYWTSRIGLTWMPTDRIQNYLLGYYTFSKDNGTGTVIEGFNKSGLNYGIANAVTAMAGLPPIPQPVTDLLNLGCTVFNLEAPSTNCGDDILAEQRARGIRNVQLSGDPDDYLKTGAVIDQMKFEINDQLFVRNIASYGFLEHSFRWNFSGSRAAMDTITNPTNVPSTKASQITEELQLQGTLLDERLKFVVGGYYQNNRPTGPQEEDVTALFLSSFAEHYGVNQVSYAPYAQGTYDLGGLLDALDGLKFTSGVRYTTDHVDGFSDAGAGPHSARLSKAVMTYTAGLDKQFESTLLYGKISRGYKAGGFLLAAANPADYTSKPEFVTNYEIGQKSDFHIGSAPARLNTALYYTDYSDMQRAGTDTYVPPGGQQKIGGAIFTAGKAEIAGAEMEATVRPFRGMTLMANYALTYGKYKQYHLTNGGINPQLDCTGQNIGQGGTEDLHCLPFQAAPRHQTSVTARYLLPVDVIGGKMDGSVTYSWTDKQYSSSYEMPETEPGAWIGSVGLLNANLSWAWLIGNKSAVDLRFFGTNLTNRTYRISNSNVWNILYFQSSIYGEPRIFGVQLSYGWGE